MVYGNPNFPCFICLYRSIFHSYKMMSNSYKRMSDAYQEFLPIRPSEFLQIWTSDFLKILRSKFSTCSGFLHTKQLSETSLFFCKNSEYCKYFFAWVSTFTFANMVSMLIADISSHTRNLEKLRVLKICVAPPPYFLCKNSVFCKYVFMQVYDHPSNFATQEFRKCRPLPIFFLQNLGFLQIRPHASLCSPIEFCK